MEAVHISPLEELAASIQRRSLVEPAIFFLELMKPLVGCMRELYGVSEPLQRTLFGKEILSSVRELLASRENVETLITLLESKPKV
jgi:hypothetical protein